MASRTSDDSSSSGDRSLGALTSRPWCYDEPLSGSNGSVVSEDTHVADLAWSGPSVHAQQVGDATSTDPASTAWLIDDDSTVADEASYVSYDSTDDVTFPVGPDPKDAINFVMSAQPSPNPSTSHSPLQEN